VSAAAVPPLTIKQHQLVRRALPMVDEEAARLKRKYGWAVEEEDLRSAGKLALYQCASRFDEQRRVPFEGYARFRVRGAMRSLVKAETRGARLKREMTRAAAERMADYHDDYDVLRDDLTEIQRRLDLMCDRQASATWLAGASQARREADQDPEAAAEYAQVLDALEDVVAPLAKDERALLDLVFGCGFNLERTAEELGVVKDTAWRRIHRVLDKLRVALAALGVTRAPEPMSHPAVRPLLLVRALRPGSEADDEPPASGDPPQQR
jgi:RNA polymerase sigma factor (sigma-70 family)